MRTRELAHVFPVAGFYAAAALAVKSQRLSDGPVCDFELSRYSEPKNARMTDQMKHIRPLKPSV